MAFFGTTPGKLLFGVKVRTEEGRRLSLGESVSRSLDVLVRGQALGIPVAALFAHLVAWGVITADGATTWDARGNYVVRHAPLGVIRMLLIPFVFIYSLAFVCKTSAELRPDLVPTLAATTPWRALPGMGGELKQGPAPVQIVAGPSRTSPKPRKAAPKKLLLVKGEANAVATDR